MNALAQPTFVHHLHPEDFSTYTLRALFAEARLLMHQERAIHYRLTAVLRELDARVHMDGKPLRLARWLHDTFGLTFGAAREKVRTARALGELPLIDAAFRDGQLSYSKVRALTRAATPENEAELVEIARRTSADGVEQVVRRIKQNACLHDVQAMIQARALSTRWDDTGMLVIQGKLTPEQGEVFLKALAKATEALSDKEADGETYGEADAETDGVTDAATGAEAETYWARRADALTLIMGESLSDAPNRASAPGDRHQVVVHVAAEALAENVSAETSPENVSAETLAVTVTAENPPENVSAETPSVNTPADTPFDKPFATPLHPETVRRLACDGGLLTIVEKDNGDPLNVGRKTRAIPPSTRRALLARDRHCQFPGCAHDRYVEGHHIVHWAHGGETRLDNLVLLCSRHHRAVHEFGYRIQRRSDGTFRVVKPGVRKPAYTGVT
jgi:hypothetical protein